MIDIRKSSAALALGLTVGLALTVATTPTLAKQRGAHSGYNARAQELGSEGGALTGGPRALQQRDKALRDCNDQVAPLKDYTWGEEQGLRYRACMAEHGQPE